MIPLLLMLLGAAVASAAWGARRTLQNRRSAANLARWGARQRGCSEDSP